MSRQDEELQMVLPQNDVQEFRAAVDAYQATPLGTRIHEQALLNESGGRSGL
jgi:hypothetical protein